MNTAVASTHRLTYLTNFTKTTIIRPRLSYPEANMSNALDYIAEHLPEIKLEEIRSRFTAVEIRDPEGFAAELQEFVRDSFSDLTQRLPEAFADDPVAGAAHGVLRAQLERQAAALQAQTRWEPSDTDIQRGRVIMLDEYTLPSNLPIQRFAELAHKSRQQIYVDIQSRRLLSLSIGPRKQKIPDWQLDRTKLGLTQAVLAGAPDVDNWTLYKALSEPLESLGGRSPVAAVEPDSIGALARTVFNLLGIIREKAPQ